MSYKEILKIVPTISSAALVSENYKVLKKKKKKTGDLFGLGIKNIVGTSLIQSQAQLID